MQNSNRITFFSGLHWAVYNRRHQVVKILIQHQLINLNVKDSAGNNALYHAIERDENIALSLLTSDNIDIDSTVLLHACKKKR